jgi:hypothetical protein
LKKKKKKIIFEMLVFKFSKHDFYLSLLILSFFLQLMESASIEDIKDFKSEINRGKIDYTNHLKKLIHTLFRKTENNQVKSSEEIYQDYIEVNDY